jgi:hypothetical protein
MNFHLALNPWLVAVQFFFYHRILGRGRPRAVALLQSSKAWDPISGCPIQMRTLGGPPSSNVLGGNAAAGSHDGGRCGCPGSIADPATSSVLAATFACPGRPNSDTHKTVTLCAVLLPILRLVWLTARRHVS